MNSCTSFFLISRYRLAAISRSGESQFRNLPNASGFSTLDFCGAGSAVICGQQYYIQRLISMLFTADRPTGNHLPTQKLPNNRAGYILGLSPDLAVIRATPLVVILLAACGGRGPSSKLQWHHHPPSTS